MNAEIIAVNNTAGTNSQFLSHELAAYGITASHLAKADNNCARLREVIRLALSRNDLVVISGGLDCDGGCAREAVADVLGTPLELHEESWERIREYYQNTNREMPEECRNQAMLPRGCTVFPNDHGSAPGCAVTRYGQQVILLPDMPSEMLPMFSDYVAPYLSNLTDGTIVSRTIGVFGLSESVLTERLADLMSEANPGVASYAKDGEAILRVTARAADRRAALSLCDPVVEDIQQRLGVNIYGIDVGSLQKAVVALLLDKNMKIATAESCTAGLLSSRLTEVTGVSAVFECGIAAYSPEIKHSVLGVPNDLIQRFGTVSPEVAGAMASGARRVGKASLGVGITGVAGPDASEGKPVGTVYIAVADEKRVWVKKISIEALDGEADRDSIRALATSHALDLVRRYLEALPTVMAGGEIINPDNPAEQVIPQSNPSTKKNGFFRRLFPCRGDRRIEIVRKLALLISALILAAFLLSFLYVRVFRPLENQRLFSNLAELYDASNPVIPTNVSTFYPEGLQAQFYALYARNPDIRGWVKIDDTNINYPVMQDSEESFYQKHNFDLQSSHYGVPFFRGNTAMISRESVNRSLLIYGNNTHDGQMFSDLSSYYNNLDFFKHHPIIEMNTIFKKAKWKIFSVMIVTEPNSDKSNFDYTKCAFTDEADFLKFSGDLRIRSLYTITQGQADVQEGDSLLLLSTDFEDTADYEGTRLLVAARMIRPGESESTDLSGAAYNKFAVMPSEWPYKTEDTQKTTPSRTNTTLAQNPTTIPTSSRETAKTDKTQAVTTKESKSSTGSTATTTTQNEQPDPEGPTLPGDADNPPTSLPTNPPDNYTPPEILAGSAAEAEFLKYCKVQSGSELIQPANKAELQTLLARVVKTEMGSTSMISNNLAAQKAQAIASYTYILYYYRTNGKPYGISLKDLHLNDTNHKEYETDKKIYDAVSEVTGMKILANSVPICAMYFASSAGFTSYNVYDVPYSSVISAYETAELMPATANWKSAYSISMSILKSKLEAKFGSIFFEPGSQPFFVKSYDVNGQYVLLTNAYYKKGNDSVYITGHQLRAALNTDLSSGDPALRSHAFTVAGSTDDTLSLSVTGYGHGVGLSQWGATNYAKYAGWSYQQILSHYYSITNNSSHRLVYPVW